MWRKERWLAYDEQGVIEDSLYRYVNDGEILTLTENWFQISFGKSKRTCQTLYKITLLGIVEVVKREDVIKYET